MKQAIDETARRRKTQLAYNAENNIKPQTIRKAIRMALADQLRARQVARQAISASEDEYDLAELIAALEQDMFAAAEALQFEKAALLRDRIAELKGEDASDDIARPPKKTGRKGWRAKK